MITVEGAGRMEISPALLKFADKSLESSYVSSVAATSHLPIDLTMSTYKLATAGPIVCCVLTGILPTTPMGTCAWCWYLALLALHHGVIRHLPNLYITHRRWLVFVMKLALALSLTALVPTTLLQEVHSPMAVVAVLSLGAGLVMQLCTGVCLPVIWRYHVPSALVTFVAYNILMLKPLIETLMCTPTALSTTSAIYSTLDSAAYSVGGLLMPYPGERPAGAGPRAQVYILVLWLQLQLALLGPGLCLYYFEARSRALFLRQQPQPPPLMHRSSATELSQRISSCRSLDMWKQPLTLVVAFILVLALMLWNLLHLVIERLMPLLDGSGACSWVIDLAVKHGKAQSCLAG